MYSPRLYKYRDSYVCTLHAFGSLFTYTHGTWRFLPLIKKRFLSKVKVKYIKVCIQINTIKSCKLSILHHVQYSTVQFSTVQHNTVQYITVQYSTCTEKYFRVQLIIVHLLSHLSKLFGPIIGVLYHFQKSIKWSIFNRVQVILSFFFQALLCLKGLYILLKLNLHLWTFSIYKGILKRYVKKV